MLVKAYSFKSAIQWKSNNDSCHTLDAHTISAGDVVEIGYQRFVWFLLKGDRQLRQVETSSGATGLRLQQQDVITVRVELLCQGR